MKSIVIDLAFVSINVLKLFQSLFFQFHIRDYKIEIILRFCFVEKFVFLKGFINLC